MITVDGRGRFSELPAPIVLSETIEMVDTEVESSSEPTDYQELTRLLLFGAGG